MSYILDALKKLENEKTSKNRGSGMLNISGELFREERRHSTGGMFWKITVVVVVASLVTFGATWFFLKTDKSSDISKPASSMVRPVAPSQPPPLPLSASTPQVPLVTPQSSTPLNQTVTPAVPIDNATVPSVLKQQENRQNMPKKLVSLAKQQEQPSVPIIPAPADINVSGIAWQDEHSGRRAVVNGFLLQEGGIVSSAKITEIFQDRVRFARDGKVFEVYLLSTGLPGAAK